MVRAGDDAPFDNLTLSTQPVEQGVALSERDRSVLVAVEQQNRGRRGDGPCGVRGQQRSERFDRGGVDCEVWGLRNLHVAGRVERAVSIQ